MRPRSLNKFTANTNDIFRGYNLALRRKRTKTQWIIRSLIATAILIFSSGFIIEFTNLTGLNSRGAVVSAHEAPKKFNPVKMILERGDSMTEADYILVGNLMRIRLAIKQLEDSAVHSNEVAEYGLDKAEVIKVLVELRAMENRAYTMVEKRWSNETSTE